MPFFKSYSNTEIVDALVEVRDTWMMIAGVANIPQMLGKADNRYINATTVCQDIALANVTSRQMEDKLRSKRDARDEKERWFVAYRTTMPTQIAADPRERLQAEAPAYESLTTEAPSRGIKITAREYGAKWPFTIPVGELACIDGAVIMHAPSGTYNLNGNAMGRYKDTYKSFREIAKPYPGLEHESQAKMFPDSDMIQRGRDLCGLRPAFAERLPPGTPE